MCLFRVAYGVAHRETRKEREKQISHSHSLEFIKKPHQKTFLKREKN